MKPRYKQYILAAVLLLVGLVIFLPIETFNLAPFLLFLCGLALLLVYKTKRNAIVLVLGGYITFIGAMNILQMFIDNGITGSLFRAMWFVVPGIIFMILYLDKGKRKMLIPASILIWVGVYVFVQNIGFIHSLLGGLSLFALFIGLAFFTIYFMSGGYGGKWSLYVGAAAILVFIVRTAVGMFASLGQAAGLVAIILGIYVLVKTIRRKR